MIIWSRVAGFLVVGYLSMARSFAYLGVPPLFIGEMVLGAFLLLKPRVALGTWAASLLRASPLSALGLALLVFVLYGVWQMGRGIVGGSSIFYTLKFFVFNYYTIYLFLGVWIGLQAPDFLPRLVRVIAWANGIYGLLWVLVLKDVVVPMPAAGVTLFGAPPAGGAVAILGLLCFERDLRAVWQVLALNIAVTLAIPTRSVWLGLAVGGLVWGLLTGRLGRVVALGVAGLAVVGIIELAGMRLGSVSFDEILGRAIAPIDAELAEEWNPRAGVYASTLEWRQKWWDEIWRSVHSAPMLEAFGHGYGFDLFALAPEEVRAGQEEEIRTPHSVFFYALGYTGWVGVALFAALQFALLRLLWRSYRDAGQPAGVVWWFMGMSMACFEAGFDTPYKAIPFYLLMGLSMAPGLQPKGELDARPARAQLLPVAGR
ncbi:MAG: O-antigen ligase family protein [Geminicoccaceae bacterium]